MKESLRQSFADFELGLYREVYEMKAIFEQMKTEVEQCSVEKRYFEIEKKELFIENERLLEKIISQDIVCTAMHSYDDLVKYAEMEKGILTSTVDFQDMKNVEFFEINELKAQLQKKNTTIRNLKDHIAKLKRKIMSDCTVLVNNSNVITPRMFKLELHPLSPKLRKNREAHEWLVYVSATCPSSRNESEKLVAVTPMNKNRKVRFAKPSTSTSNTQKRVEAHSNQNTNRHLLPSTRVKSSTDASRSNPKSNTRNNRISQTSSSNKKNQKVEDHPRNVKSSLNNTNRVSVCNANVKHVVIRIDGTKCLLTRITSTKVVPPRKPVQTKVITKTPPSSVSPGKPNETKIVSSSSNPRIVEPMQSNNLEANQNWGSNVSNSPSSSRVQCMSYRSSSEGLGHNLFSVGQLCDFDLEVAFRKHTYCVRDLDVVDLLTGSRGTNLYTLSLEDMMKSSPICLLSKAFKTKSWLWH
ncbi:hypothetical protein Tco_0709122 [Tanacetum coccineum]